MLGENKALHTCHFQERLAYLIMSDAIDQWKNTCNVWLCQILTNDGTIAMFDYIRWHWQMMECMPCLIISDGIDKWWNYCDVWLCQMALTNDGTYAMFDYVRWHWQMMELLPCLIMSDGIDQWKNVCHVWLVRWHWPIWPHVNNYRVGSYRDVIVVTKHCNKENQ